MTDKTPAMPDTMKSAERVPTDFGAADAVFAKRLFAGIEWLPRLSHQLAEQGRQISAMREEIGKLQKPAAGADGWLDAKAAARYMSISSGTFDKYRSHSNPAIKGYRVGGKYLYRREDLDNYVRLWETKSVEAS